MSRMIHKSPPGGTAIGKQGGSGSGEADYDPSADIVGTPAAVARFALANQSGTFQTRKRQ
jgi:hypothetical protein